MTFVESGVNRDLRASLASEASQALQRHQYFSVYSRLHKSWETGKIFCDTRCPGQFGKVYISK